jgi:hypothetical protein
MDAATGEVLDDGETKVIDHRHLYFSVPAGTHAQVKARCDKVHPGATLAIINSQTDNDAAEEVCQLYLGHDECFIGLTRHAAVNPHA